MSAGPAPDSSFAPCAPTVNKPLRQPGAFQAARPSMIVAVARRTHTIGITTSRSSASPGSCQIFAHIAPDGSLAPDPPTP